MSRYDIAVIGMGCVFPHANSIETYWNNIASGDTFFSEMPKSLWHMDSYFSETLQHKSYTKIGSFIKNFEFPFLDYKLPPKAMQGVDPAQLVTLEATRQALQDAGIEARSKELEEGITVIGGSGVDLFAHSCAYVRRHRYFRLLRPILEQRGVPAEQLDELEHQTRAGTAVL